MDFSFSNQDIRSVGEFPTPLYQDLGCVPHLLRSTSYLGRQDGTTEEMRARSRGKVCSAPWTEVRAPTQGIGGQLHHGELEIARSALGDVVVGAVHEQ
jgi:hypothetical protein